VAATACLVAPGARAGTPVPGAPSCPVYPADNVWSTDISTLPVHSRSAQWLASMSAATTRLHPDFGPSFGAQPVPYGIPFIVIDKSHPKVHVSFTYASESDPGPYPFGSDTPIEGGPNASGDRHAIMVDSSTCTLFELFDAHYAASGSTAGSGAVWDLRSNGLRPATWTSADAAGLPILPGLVRPDEVAAGVVSHAIRFTAARTDRSFLWPARHQAGSASDPTLPPMGARFRLKAGFDISSYRPDTQVILRAMQHYGLILADNGSNWFFQGSADNGWDSAMLDQLKTIPASAFEAIDESSLMVDPNSGQARQPGGTPPPPAVPVVPGGGYWLVAADGGVFSFGDAHFAGSTGALHLASPVVGMAATPSGHGYWLVAADGGVFSFGDAHFAGSTGALHLASPVVGMAATPSGHGYWLVAADGGVFSFGDAHFAGALPGGDRAVALVRSADGLGYWVARKGGGVDAFGDAPAAGGPSGPSSPVVALAATPSGHGYRVVSSDGGVFSFGDASFLGSLGAVRLAAPIVGAVTAG
jgi:hypothetical protein